MRWPLRYQFLLPFGGAMLVVVVGVSLLDAVLAARRTQRQIEHQLQGVAQTLHDATFPLTDAVLKQTSGLSGAQFVLTDAQGHPLASSLDALVKGGLAAPSHVGGEVRLRDQFDLDGEPYLHTAIAIHDRQSSSGALRLLHILYPRDVLRQARWQAAYPPLVVGGLLLLVVVALAVSLADRLARPIVALGEQLSRLVEGRFQPLPEPRHNDELRDLVRSVNFLGDQLEEMRRAINRAERLALLGQLSGGLAHQLRNSVAGARIAVQLHKRHCTQLDQESLAVALRQLTITESHLSRFLTAGQPTAARPAECNLRDIVADVAALVGPACKHRGVRLETSDGGHSLPLRADAEQLRQLLLNLVLNGIEAAGSSGWVRVELALKPRSIVIRVLDSGPGPSAELAQHLFEPFVTGKPEGIGLGLAVAQRIVEAHRGTIRYTGASPTCFEIVLPLEGALSPAEAARTSTPLAAGCQNG